ncbi:MAG TPA: hypothetical protein VGE62_01860 [Candidatus Paceibacterota bacterium]
MKKQEAQALLADKSEKGASGLLSRAVQSPGDWSLVLGRYQAPVSETPIEEDDLWAVIAVHRNAGLQLSHDGSLLQSHGGARHIRPHGASDGGNAHQETLKDGVVYWHWDMD